MFVSYPETDIGWNDLHKVAHFFQNLGITTITLTTNPHLLSAAAEERLFLIHENGFLYDIIDLKKELTAFGLVKKGDLSNVSKSLALHDFNQDYLLLSTEIKEFLLSNRV